MAAMTPLPIKRNDTGDVIAFDCTNIPDGVASAVFTMTRLGASTPLINKETATFVANDDESGRVSYTFVEGDTDTSGRYRAEFELTLDDDNIVTYPADSYIQIWIRDDLA
jgi:hypothetical protein